MKIIIPEENGTRNINFRKKFFRFRKMCGIVHTSTAGDHHQMNDLDYVIVMLQTSNKSAVARAVGLSDRTVRDVASGVQKSPSFETIRKLAEHFRSRGVK